MRMLPPVKIVIIAICGLLCLPLIACDNKSGSKKRPVAARGVLDLRDWNFERDGSVNLDGEWEFWWNRLLTPADFGKPDVIKDRGFINVPGLWKDSTVNSLRLPGKGHATYRLIILSGTETKIKSLSLRRVLSAYRLWLNGKLADEKGTADRSLKTREDYIFVHNKRLSSFTLTEGTNEITLQVLNRDYESGGVDRPVKLDNSEAEAQKEFINHTTLMIIFGMLMFASIYNILLYFFRRKDMASLHFGFFCFAMAINTFNHQFPILSGSLSYPRDPFLINYITVILIVSACTMTVKSMFPDEFSPLVKWISIIMTVCCIVMLIPVEFTTAEKMMKFYFIWLAANILYNVLVIINAILNRRKDALLFFAGFFIVFVCGINDILYALWIIDTTNVTQYGLVVLCITASLVFSRRFSRALHTVEDLSHDLKEKNVSLEKLDRLKDQLLANTSHELRTPLHGMIGLSESMLEGAAGHLSMKARENLSLIASSGHRLADMVNDILDMAKLQDEGLNLNLRPVDLHALSEMVVKLSLPLASGKPLEIINSIGPDIPAAHADEDRIRQVLCNLVGNAIKFTNRGTVELSARVLHADNDPDMGKTIEVTVSDTGIGIPKEYREKIFEAYRQVDGGDTRSYPGTGLGLAIAKQIIELHDGMIWAGSDRHGGAVFRFTLPAAAGPAPSSRDLVIIESMNEAPGAEGSDTLVPLPDGICDEPFTGKPVILVVDDDPICIRIIQNYFEPRRCAIRTATDGIKALEIIDNGEPIDLVLLDIMMPIMSGYDVCRRIRLKRPPEELPVIMLTAKNMMADINAAFDAGANDYIVKPFRIRELMARTGTMLKLRNVRRSAAEGITVRDRTRAYSLRFSDIIHITSHSKNIVLHTAEGDVEVPVQTKEIIERLPPDLFIRIHKSHIINLRYVHSITHVLSGRYRVRLRDHDDTELPVGSAFLDALRKKI